jgi:hypothetical protein
MHTRARAHTSCNAHARTTRAPDAHLVRRWRICNSCMSLALCRCCKSWCAHSATVNSIISAEVPPPSKQACVRMFGGVWARVGLAAVVLEVQTPVPACNATRAVPCERNAACAVQCQRGTLVAGGGQRSQVFRPNPCTGDSTKYRPAVVNHLASVQAAARPPARPPSPAFLSGRTLSLPSRCVHTQA